MVAASNGHVEVVEELLSAGASVNYTETVSHYTVEVSHVMNGGNCNWSA